MKRGFRLRSLHARAALALGAVLLPFVLAGVLGMLYLLPALVAPLEEIVGEVVLISVPYGSLPAVGKELGDSIKGKVVIDTCNPFPERDGEVAKWAPALLPRNYSPVRASSARSMRSAFPAWEKRTKNPDTSACRSRAMISRQSRSRRA